MALDVASGFNVKELVRDLGGVIGLLEGVQNNAHLLTLGHHEGVPKRQGLEALDISTDFSSLEEILPH